MVRARVQPALCKPKAAEPIHGHLTSNVMPNGSACKPEAPPNSAQPETDWVVLEPSQTASVNLSERRFPGSAL